MNSLMGFFAAKMSVKEKFSNDINSITKKRIWELIRTGLYTFLFIAIIIHLNEYDNKTFQEERDNQAFIAMLFFSLLLLVLYQIRINYKSILISIFAILPIAIYRIYYFRAYPIYMYNNILLAIIEWIAVLLVTDMVFSGKIKKTKEINIGVLSLYSLMVVFLIECGQIVGNKLIFFLFILLFLLPVKKSEWNRVIIGLLNAGVLSFIAVVMVSHFVNPYFQITENGLDRTATRWYGYFVNIGAFGQFLALSTALAIVSILVAKKRHGRKNVYYILSVVSLIIVIFIAILNGTDNYLISVLFLSIVLFVFGSQKSNRFQLALRGGIAILLVAIFCWLVWIALVYMVSSSFDIQSLKNEIQKLPIPALTGSISILLDKVEGFVSLRGIDSHFIHNPFLTFLNRLGSNRLSIWRLYLQATDFKGQGSGSFSLENYFIYNAHNQYVQVLYEYGFLGGGVFIIFFVASWIVCIVRYTKEKTEDYFLPMVCVTIMLGMWLGECSYIYYPLTFISLLVLTPIFKKGENQIC